MANGERPQFPSHCPPAYSELAQQCMLSDFRQRPSTEAVVSRLTAMRGPVESGGLEDTMCVPRAIARSEALRMIRVMSMGGVLMYACMGEGRGTAYMGTNLSAVGRRLYSVTLLRKA